MVATVFLVAIACGSAGGDLDGNVDQFAAIPANLSEFQRGLVSDGEVTDSEMEQALAAFAQCIRGRGFEIDGVVLQPGQGWTYEISAGTIADEDVAFVEKADLECADEYLDFAGDLYMAQNTLTSAELAADHQRITDCLVAEYGYPIPADTPIEDVLDSVSLLDFADCNEQG